MIELIFVIVILGILAAVAVPKLAATRDDAKIVGAVTNTNQIIKDFTAFYTARGDFNTTSIDQISNGTDGAGFSNNNTFVPNTPLQPGILITFTNAGQQCFHMDINSSNTGATIALVQDSNVTTVCDGINRQQPNQTFTLGGTAVRF